MNLRSRKFIQTYFLFSSTVLGIILGFLINSFLTKSLGKEQYGNYALLINILTFCQIIFNFGLFYSISRLVAVSKDNNKIRGYYFVGCFLVFFIFLLMSGALVVYAFFFNTIRDNNMLGIFLLAIPFSWVYILTNLNENFLQGNNSISLLSLSRLLPKAFYILILLVVYLLGVNIDLTLIVLLNFVTLLATYAIIIVKIKPARERYKRRFYEIIISNKKFGFDIYLGSLIASGSASLSGILISHFGANNVEVGYYTLATLLASPLSLIPNVLATVQFKKFALSPRIDKELTILMLSISLVVFLLIIVCSKAFVITFFGVDYINVVEILVYLSIGYLFYGVGDYFNRFLLAKGKGKELRTASLYVGITLLFANFVFIKLLGASGAAIARIASGLMYTIVILYFYNKNARL